MRGAPMPHAREDATMARPAPVTTQRPANQKPARMLTPALVDLLDSIGQDAVGVPELKCLLGTRDLIAMRRPAVRRLRPSRFHALSAGA